jgi:VanZ family protein
MNKEPKWDTKIDFDPTQRDKLMHMIVSEGVATVGKQMGLNSWQSWLLSFFGFGVTKEIIDSFTHYGDINDLIADAIGATAGSFLKFDIKF